MPAPWSKAFAAIAEREGIDPASQGVDGTWWLSVDCALSSVGSLLAMLPAELELAHEDAEEMFDDTGAGVDWESISRVLVSRCDRVILSTVEHWQAGLCASLSLYGSVKAFDEALATLVQEREEEAASFRS